MIALSLLASLVLTTAALGLISKPSDNLVAAQTNLDGLAPSPSVADEEA